MRKKIPKHYFNKTFRQDYWIFIGWSKRLYLKYCREVFNVEDDKGISYGESFVIEGPEHDRAIVIWVEDRTRLDLLSHECVHAANFTLDCVGAVPSFKDDEVQAYLVQELFRECSP